VHWCEVYLVTANLVYNPPPMTHAEIIAWWALVLAIAALVFHVPLTMLAHHYLPKVENYFASYSKERLSKRIAKLQGRLAQLNDPNYFEEMQWMFREHLFVVMYLFGTGFATQAVSLFLATGAVPRTSWFWNPHSAPSFGNRYPEIAVAFFFSGVLIAGLSIRKSSSLRPSRRPGLRVEIQTQINALKAKFDEFDNKSGSA
jgi:hypothetical protein